MPAQAEATISQHPLAHCARMVSLPRRSPADRVHVVLFGTGGCLRGIRCVPYCMAGRSPTAKVNAVYVKQELECFLLEIPSMRATTVVSSPKGRLPPSSRSATIVDGTQWFITHVFMSNADPVEWLTDLISISIGT